MPSSAARRVLSATALTGLALSFVLLFSEASLADSSSANDRYDSLATYSTEQLIDGLMSTIKGSKRPLPVWAIEMASRAYETWKTYQNGQKVEEVEKVVLSILAHVAEIKDQVETGRAMSEREYRLTRELLDAHARAFDGFVSQIRQIEDRLQREAVRMAGCEGRTDELHRGFQSQRM
jgi:hypothetical protein